MYDAGNALGLRNDVKIQSPLFYLHVVLDMGASFGPPNEHSERGIYLVKGAVEISGQRYSAGQMIVFTKGSEPTLR